MAFHTSLSIYKVAYELLSIAVDYVQHMPRQFKQAIGGRVTGLCIELVLLIARANAARDKAPVISKLLESLQELEVLLRICQDKRFISKGQYGAAIKLTQSVGRQANGWKNYNATSPAT